MPFEGACLRVVRDMEEEFVPCRGCLRPVDLCQKHVTVVVHIESERSGLLHPSVVTVHRSEVAFYMHESCAESRDLL